MTHHTKDKGDLGLLKAQVDLHLKGWLILLPLTEHSPFDLVIYKDGEFKRVQVKYRTINKNGCIVVPFTTSWADKNGIHTKKYDKKEIDVFCLYCPDTDLCYYVDPNKFKESVQLRMIESKNNQIKKVNFAKDYLDF